MRKKYYFGQKSDLLYFVQVFYGAPYNKRNREQRKFQPIRNCIFHNTWFDRLKFLFSVLYSFYYGMSKPLDYWGLNILRINRYVETITHFLGNIDRRSK